VFVLQAEATHDELRTRQPMW